MNYLQNNRSNSGFTVIETITALLMIGILSGIAAPSWFALIKTQHLNIAQDQVYQAKRQAQSQAKKEKVKYQASFRTQNNILQWAVHEEKESDLNNPMIKWNDLDDSVQLDPNSTLQLYNGVRRVRFDDIGGVTPPLGKITLSSKSGGTAKRCVIVSTILGAMRTAKDNSCN
ncbi:prepilin-type N-terminal cleavage/methylation domain-containing protein [Anabaena sp. 90]|uniref:pilus assembly FimT family protein n=1 Tax=Anabaena sp. 90 TaxID=46234 RepID=UPI00029B5A93|nr:prepilin-type N-terminal cleavage/methylation domain-containing protein [Anabaena sp. 90]AFW95048.1 prepilin-type N-terminal cleavage/methylation domain-containing protein [Anabaena sp. 90]